MGTTARPDTRGRRLGHGAHRSPAAPPAAARPEAVPDPGSGARFRSSARSVLQRAGYCLALALGVTLTTPLAHAASPPGGAPDAATLLSRFPAGAVPDSPPVHAAIDALAARDDGDALALLASLRRLESGAVRDHALEAEDLVAGRALAVLRAEAAHKAPSERDVRTWMQAHQPAGVPTTELRVVGYAALVTRGIDWSDRAIGALPPDATSELVARAEALELDGRDGAALPLLVDAAVSGDARATHALMARGVDMDRLVLGLSSEHAAASGLPSLHLAPVVQTDDPRAVRVLLSRAESGGALPRLAAIENLGVLLRDGHLDATLQARARDTLARATVDGRPAIRRTAQSALASNGGP